MRLFSTFLVGVTFGLGLVIAQMTNPAKILGFLDVAGNWDPSLAVVMGAALLTTTVGYRVVLNWSAPVLEPQFQLPAKTEIDPPMLAGAAIFGIGWAMAGLCPGPGLVALTQAWPQALIFVLAMFLGMGLRHFIRL